MTNNNVCDCVPVNYSFEEQPTGDLWVDGKAVYRKIVNVGSLPAKGSKTTAHGISGLQTLISFGGVAFNAAGTRIALPHAHTAAPVNVLVDATGIKITTVSSGGHGAFSGHVTLLYTKIVG